jgi:serine protease Do
MSLFEDDFYSTKVRTRPSRWIRPQEGKPLKFPPRGEQRRLWTVAILSLAAGILLTVLVLGGGGRSTGDRVVAASEKVRPAVVSVLASVKDPVKETPVSLGIGSGVIFQKQGGKARIVTNNHVVEGATQIDVVLSGGEHKAAALVGKDPLSDLAVLEVDASGIKTVAEFGDSDAIKLGETAIALGNPLGLGYSPTITVGVVSSPKRTIPVSLNQDGEPDWELDVIQTDAAINQGNSGGALVDLNGKVIGINSLKVADTGVEGLGFAIPINQAKPILAELISDHKVKRPFMGVTSQNLQSFTGTDVLKLPQDVKTGIIVLDAVGPAQAAGLKSNDVIVQLDDQPVASTLELRKYLYSHKKIGDKLKVTFYRNSKKETVTLTLGEPLDG